MYTIYREGAESSPENNKEVKKMRAKIEKRDNLYAQYFDNNWASNIIKLRAKTVLGAKREAWERACGSHTSVTIITQDNYPLAYRDSIDQFKGFCCGAKKWEDV